MNERTIDTINVMMDAAYMLEFYVSGKSRNWDGSTERQAQTIIKELREIIAKARASGSL